MEEQKVYEGDFNSWQDVILAFHGLYDSSDEKDKQQLMELHPEPNVLYAEYGGGGYDGDAVVAYYQDGKFYTVEGGHCSCYGLEDQWSPEEYEPDIFIAVLDRKIGECWDESGDYPSYNKTVWRLIKQRAQELILKEVQDG